MIKIKEVEPEGDPEDLDYLAVVIEKMDTREREAIRVVERAAEATEAPAVADPDRTMHGQMIRTTMSQLVSTVI